MAGGRSVVDLHVRRQGAKVAYIPGFLHDIFLSYAHVDDLQGWIRRFQGDLEIKLAQRFGRIGAVSLWRDTRIAGNQLFDATIQEALERSAILVAITSMGHLKSEYCQREVAEFHRKAARERFGAVIGDRSRIVNVLLYNIPPDEWPAPYGRTAGVSFHSPELGKLGRTHAPGSPAYDTQLHLLADAIHDLLDAFARKSAEPIEANELRQDDDADAKAVPAMPAELPQTSSENEVSKSHDREDSFSVFVADVADTLRAARDRVVGALSRNGCRIATGVPPPYEAVAHDKYLAERLPEVDVSVHLLDRLAGRPIDGNSGFSYPGRQLEQALAHAPASIVWHGDDREPGHPAAPFAAALGRIKDRRSLRVVGALENLEADIVDAVEQARQRKGAKAAARTVLLDFHSKDFAYAVRLHDGLEGHGFTVLAGPDADRPRRNLEIFEQRLRQAGTLVIPMANVSYAWVRERVNSALQVIAAAQCPTTKILIPLAPTCPVPNERLSIGSVEVKWLGGAGSPSLSDKGMEELLREMETPRP